MADVKAINSGLRLVNVPVNIKSAGKKEIKHEKLLVSFRDGNKTIGPFFSRINFTFPTKDLPSYKIEEILKDINEQFEYDNGVFIEEKDYNNGNKKILQVTLPADRKSELLNVFKKEGKYQPFLTEKRNKVIEWNLASLERVHSLPEELVKASDFKASLDFKVQKYEALLSEYSSKHNKKPHIIRKAIHAGEKPDYLSEHQYLKLINWRNELKKDWNTLNELLRKLDPNAIALPNKERASFDMHINFMDYISGKHTFSKIHNTGTIDSKLFDYSTVYSDTETEFFDVYGKCPDEYVERFRNLVPKLKNKSDDVIKRWASMQLRKMKTSVSSSGFVYNGGGESKGVIFTTQDLGELKEFEYNGTKFTVINFSADYSEVASEVDYFKKKELSNFLKKADKIKEKYSADNDKEKLQKELQNLGNYYGVAYRKNLTDEDIRQDVISSLSEMKLRDATEEFILKNNFYWIVYQYGIFDIEVMKGIKTNPKSKKSWAVGQMDKPPKKTGNGNFGSGEYFIGRYLRDTVNMSRIFDPDMQKHNLEALAEKYGIELKSDLTFEKSINYLQLNYLSLLNRFGDVEAGRTIMHYFAEDLLVLKNVDEAMKPKMEIVSKVAQVTGLQVNKLLEDARSIRELWDKKWYETHGTYRYPSYQHKLRSEQVKEWGTHLDAQKTKIFKDDHFYNPKEKESMHKDVIVAFVPRSYFVKPFLKKNFNSLGGLLDNFNPVENTDEQLIYTRYLNSLIFDADIDFLISKESKKDYRELIKSLGYKNEKEISNIGMHHDISSDSDLRKLWKGYQTNLKGLLGKVNRFTEVLDENRKKDDSVKELRSKIKKYSRESSKGNPNQENLFEENNSAMEYDVPELQAILLIQENGIKNEKLKEMYFSLKEKYSVFLKTAGRLSSKLSDLYSDRDINQKRIEDLLYLTYKSNMAYYNSTKFLGEYSFRTDEYEKMLLEGYEKIKKFIVENNMHIIDIRGNKLYLKSNDNEHNKNIDAIKSFDNLHYLDYLPEFKLKDKPLEGLFDNAPEKLQQTRITGGQRLRGFIRNLLSLYSG